MFTAFPDGWAGVGLVLLRTTVGALLIFESASSVTDWHNTKILALLLVGLVICSGALLIAGYMTRYAAVAAALLSASGLVSRLTLSYGSYETGTSSILATAMMVAIVCLGPGAFSLDARLFGRREIIIPRASSNV